MDSIKISEKKSAKNVLIVFSARNTPKGKFTFSKRLGRIAASKIFINDYSNDWYQNGVPDIPDHKELVQFLKEKIKLYKKKGGQVWILGSSMGAYGALKFGSALAADRIVAFSPEVKLGMKFSKSAENNVLYSDEDIDLSSVSYKKSADVIIISNDGDPVDYYSATKLKNGIENSKVYSLRNFKHNILGELTKTYNIDNLLYEMVSKGSSKGLWSLEKSKLYKDNTIEAFKEINENLVTGKEFNDSYIKTIEAFIKDAPNWGYINYLYAMCLDKKGFYCAATKYYEACRELSPYLGRPIVRLAEIYFNRNDLDSVLRLLEPFCRSKHHVKAASTLAKSYMKMGLNDTAIETCAHFINNTKSQKDKLLIQTLKKEIENIE